MTEIDNINKFELKAQALSERLAQIVTEYENRIADLRVEFTLEVASRDARIGQLEGRLEAQATEDVQTNDG